MWVMARASKARPARATRLRAATLSSTSMRPAQIAIKSKTGRRLRPADTTRDVPDYRIDHMGHIVCGHGFDWRQNLIYVDDPYPENAAPPLGYGSAGGATYGKKTYERGVVAGGVLASASQQVVCCRVDRGGREMGARDPRLMAPRACGFIALLLSLMGGSRGDAGCGERERRRPHRRRRSAAPRLPRPTAPGRMSVCARHRLHPLGRTVDAAVPGVPGAQGRGEFPTSPTAPPSSCATQASTSSSVDGFADGGRGGFRSSHRRSARLLDRQCPPLDGWLAW